MSTDQNQVENGEPLETNRQEGSPTNEPSMVNREENGSGEPEGSPKKVQSADGSNGPELEPDSTVNENPVNLKVSGNANPAAEEGESPAHAGQVQQRSSPASTPLQHHVRTITLTSDYRQHEQETLGAGAHEQQVATENSMPTSTMYVEEAASGGEDPPAASNYYHHHQHEQSQQHYAEENAVAYRFGRDIVNGTGKTGIAAVELLDAAAAAAGVPGHYMMEGDDEHGNQTSPSCYMSSRLAIFQVHHLPILRKTFKKKRNVCILNNIPNVLCCVI